MCRGVAFKTAEVPGCSQLLQSAFHPCAHFLRSDHHIDEFFPPPAVHKASAWIFADDVRHWCPVEIIRDAVLKSIPCVFDRFRKDHRVDDEVELQFVFAAKFLRDLDVTLYPSGLSGSAEIDEFIAALIVRRIQTDDQEI